jgi:hypothetical protein
MTKTSDELAPVPESSGPSGDTPTSRSIIIRLSHPTHKALRIRVAEEDTSIQKWVEVLIERALGIQSAR